MWFYYPTSFIRDYFLDRFCSLERQKEISQDEIINQNDSQVNSNCKFHIVQLLL